MKELEFKLSKKQENFVQKSQYTIFNFFIIFHIFKKNYGYFLFAALFHLWAFFPNFSLVQLVKWTSVHSHLPVYFTRSKAILFRPVF